MIWEIHHHKSLPWDLQYCWRKLPWLPPDGLVLPPPTSFLVLPLRLSWTSTFPFPLWACWLFPDGRNTASPEQFFFLRTVEYKSKVGNLPSYQLVFLKMYPDPGFEPPTSSVAAFEGYIQSAIMLIWICTCTLLKETAILNSAAIVTTKFLSHLFHRIANSIFLLQM